jgi:F-type H+-transporting ATPase subunit alpha
MAVSLYAANEGYIDDVELKKVVDFEAALQSHVKSNYGSLIEKIDETGDYNDEIQGELKKAVEDFKSNGVW